VISVWSQTKKQAVEKKYAAEWQRVGNNHQKDNSSSNFLMGQLRKHPIIKVMHAELYIPLGFVPILDQSRPK
jgi:hypothetical protein